MSKRFIPLNILIILALILSFLPYSHVAAAGLTVISATPSGAGASISTQIQITFDQAIQPATFSGSIDGAPFVPTQLVFSAGDTVVSIDPGELEYARTYDVVIDSTVLDTANDPLGADYPFSFTVEDNPNPKRPTTTVLLPPGPYEAGQTYSIDGQASGFVWERDVDNPLELRHINVSGTDTGDRPMLHPAALHFPAGFDGYEHYLFYTPYPPGASENPVLFRSNDGVTFSGTGVPQNPLFTYNYQPPYDMQNLADPEAYRLGDTWMLFYEMETSSLDAQAVDDLVVAQGGQPYMKGGGYIGLALSTDGINWEPYGGNYRSDAADPGVMTYDPANPPQFFPTDGNPVIYPESSVWYEDSASAKTGEMGVFFKDGQYHLWRTVIGVGLYIAYDTAPDPRGPWTKQDAALDLGTYSVGPHPDVVYDAERDKYIMLYLIPNGTYAWQLGVQTADDPAGPWTEHPANPIFSASGGWEGSQLYRASMVNVDGQWYMYYSGNPGADGMIGLAREVPGANRVELSTDGGSTWGQAVLNPDGSWSYNWTPTVDGLYTIQARVTDDFMEGDPTSGEDVIVGPGQLLPAQNPILVITDNDYTTNPHGTYLAEILKSEGLVEFQQVELSFLMADSDPLAYLNSFNLVMIVETSLVTDEEQLLRDYVSGGGNLVAMRPDPDLADLFGLTYVGPRTEELLEFFTIDTTSEAGNGIVDVSLQYHGQADNYTLNGAAPLADLWDDISTPSSNPAVSLNLYGSGQAVAFTFDLAKSIVYTRQGNPLWKDSEGDGLGGYRPSDMFARSTGERWLAGERTRIPQADEEQRFLANLITTMIGSPLPRMWYLPGEHKALMINTGDAEGMGGTSLDQINNDAASYGGTFTHYLMESGIGSTDVALEAAWRAAGHEVGPHVYGGGDESCAALDPAYQAITSNIQTKFGHDARSARSHTIDWCGWSDMAAIEANYGTSLDTNYYHYTPWLLGYGDNANGYFTGSGLPQKFNDEDGNVLSIYQALTEWPDEWFDDNGFSVADTVQIIQDMFTAAENGYYSAFVANIHPVRYYNTGGDITNDWTNQIWAYCQANGIPMWTAEKLLDFVTARDSSKFENINWNGTTLVFDFSTPVGGQDLTLMVPAQVGGSALLSIDLDGTPVAYNTETIKGRDYAMFTTTGTSHNIIASYGLDTTPPVISNLLAQDVTDTSTSITWDTNEPATNQVDYGLDPGNLNLTESVAGYYTSHSLPLSGLSPSTTYHYQVTSIDHAGNSASSAVLSFTTSLPRWMETTEADFADGVFTDTQVTTGGSIIMGLASGFYDHFQGTQLSATDWLSRNILSNPISVTVDNSWVTAADGTYIRTNQTYFQETVEGLVTLDNGPNAHFGWATTVQSGDDGITDPHWMMFTVRNGDILARTRLDDGQGVSGGEVNTVLSGIPIGVPHNFKIVWNTDDTIEFWVDGYLEATHTRAFTEQMRVYLTSNDEQTGNADWVSVSGAYAAGGAYESSVFDSGGTANWDDLSWTGSAPAGTSVVFDTRSGNTPAPDPSWSDWQSVNSPIISPDGQYIQYRAGLSSADPAQTPRIDEVVVTYAPGPDTTPPFINSTDPADTATAVPVGNDITINYNEPIDPATFSAMLNSAPIPGGEITYQNGGSTVVINPVSDLDYLTAYTVEIAAGVEDLTGNATTSASSFSFMTTEELYTWIETTVADFNDGVLVDTQVTSTGDGEVTLAGGFFDNFPGTDLDLVKWLPGDWGGGDVNVNVADSIVTVIGMDYIKSTTTFSDTMVEGYVRYSANGNSLNFGVGTSLNAPATFMVIGPASANVMRVQTYDSHDDGSGLVTETNLTTNLTAYDSIIGDDQFHYVKVEWTASEVRYYIDNPTTPVATHTGFGRPLDGDYNVFLSSAGLPIEADWINVNAYASLGIYTSSVFDSAMSSELRNLSWQGSEPAGTGVSFETRTSNDGVNWSAWAAIDPGGNILSPMGQHVQYQVTMTTTDSSVTPVVEEVSITYAPGQDTAPPSVQSTNPADLATNVPLDTDITINYNEPINPATFNANISGGVTFTTSFINGNSTVVLNPDATLAYSTTYTVTVDAGVEDTAGNPTTSAYSFEFTTQAQLFTWTQTTVADFESGTLDRLVVTEDGNGELMLPPVLYDRFPGTSLESQWESGIYGGGVYSPIVANSTMTHTKLTASGAYVRSTMTFQPGMTVQGRVNFNKGGNTSAGYLYFGLAGDGLSPWALFGTTGTGDQLYTTVHDGGTTLNQALGDLFDEWHDYKIVWNASTVEFWLDGALVNTETITIPGPAHVYFSVSNGTPIGASVAADWVRVEEYPESLVVQLNDTFTEPDGPAANWELIENGIPSIGNWSVVGEEFVHAPTGTNTSYHPAVMTDTYPAYSDFILETRAMSPDVSGFFGLVWGLQDGRHFYFAQFYPGQGLRVFRLDDWFDSYQQLADIPTAPVPVQDLWFTLRLEGRDGTYQIYVDDTLWVEVTDTTYPSGRIGVLGYSNNISHYDDILVSAYQNTGTYTSMVFDAGGEMQWLDLSRITSQPAGTSVRFETRSSGDGINWSNWQPVASPIASSDSRYFQYRSTLSTTDTQVSPVVEEVTITYTAGQDSTPPSVQSTVPPDLATDVPLDADITINYDEPINPVTFNASISGEVTFTTSFINGNSTVVLNPDADLASLTAYTVTIDPGVEDTSGNPTPGTYSFEFTTLDQLFGWSQTTVSDFESGTLDGLVVMEDGNGELSLPPVLYDRFLGTSLGSQWTSGLYGGGAYSPIVANGVMTHTTPGSSAYVHSISNFHPGTTVEGRVNFSFGGNTTAPAIYFGLAGDGLTPWLLFGTGYPPPQQGDQVYASVYNFRGGDPVMVPLGVDLLDEWHDYKIVWNATNAEFWVDGVLRHTENVEIPEPLNVYFSVSDSSPTGASVAADWVRVEDYSGSMAEVIVEVFNDTFTEPDGPATNWESLENGLLSKGDWSVASEVLVHGPAGDSYHPVVLTDTYPAYSNFILETRAMSPDGMGFFGLAWGLQDGEHFYFAQFYPGSGLTVYRHTGWPTFTSLINVPSAPTPVSGQWFTLRLEAWDGTFQIYVDDTLWATVTDTTFTSGRVGVIGYGGNTSQYDDVVVSEIQNQIQPPEPGTYTSTVFDAGVGMQWLDLARTTSEPGGTAILFETRTGDVPTPDGTWSNWQSVSSPITSPNGRYFQYRSTLSTTDIKTSPVLEDVTVTYRQIPTAVTVVSFAAEPRLSTLSLSWKTVSEVELLGFNIYRSDVPDDPLNNTFIQANAPGEVSGSAYQFADWTVEAGETYLYILEIVTLAGKAKLEPVSATASHAVFVPLLGQ